VRVATAQAEVPLPLEFHRPVPRQPLCGPASTKPAEPALFSSRHTGELEAGSVGEDQALPRDLYTLLPIIEVRALVGADQFASLGHQQTAAGRGVKNILAYLREDRSRQVRIDAAHQQRGDDVARRDRVGERCPRAA